MSNYYTEVSESILSDPVKAIKKDTKFLSIGEKDVSIAQLELWCARSLLERDDLLQIVRQCRKTDSDLHLLIISEVASRQTHFVTEDSEIQELISNCIDLDFKKNSTASADRLWMRKEVIREFNSQCEVASPLG